MNYKFKMNSCIFNSFFFLFRLCWYSASATRRYPYCPSTSTSAECERFSFSALLFFLFRQSCSRNTLIFLFLRMCFSRKTLLLSLLRKFNGWDSIQLVDFLPPLASTPSASTRERSSSCCCRNIATSTVASAAIPERESSFLFFTSIL